MDSYGRSYEASKKPDAQEERTVTLTFPKYQYDELVKEAESKYESLEDLLTSYIIFDDEGGNRLY